MQESDDWLTHYGNNHRKVRFAAVYWISVIVLIPGAVGLFWSLPIPAEFARISPLLNWGSAFLMAAIVYYFIISMPLAIGMLPFVFGIAALQIWLADSPWSPVGVSTALLAASLTGLYLGRCASGGIRAVLHDIQLMMIAPVWLLANLYRRLGIPY